MRIRDPGEEYQSTHKIPKPNIVYEGTYEFSIEKEKSKVDTLYTSIGNRLSL